MAQSLSTRRSYFFILKEGGIILSLNLLSPVIEALEMKGGETFNLLTKTPESLALLKEGAKNYSRNEKCPNKTYLPCVLRAPCGCPP